METVIREGALRLLTAEASCDVILSCQGHRLMAHKLVLSMVSPVFRNLLLEDISDPTVIILPDINGSIMSLILDYIYTGRVIIYSNTIHEFVSVASLLQIPLDLEYPEGFLHNKNKIFRKTVTENYEERTVEKKEDVLYQEKVESADVVSAGDPEVYSKKNQRKLPHLVPISKLQAREKLEPKKKLCSYVLPSPWCTRVERVFGDPRNDYIDTYENQISPTLRAKNIEENDSNNNFKRHPHSISTYHPPSKEENMRGLYRNMPDNITDLRKKSFDVFAFESRILNKLNSSLSLDNHVKTKTTESSESCGRTANEQGQNNSQALALSKNSLPKSSVTKDVCQENLLLNRNADDSVKDSVKDSDSNHSSSAGEHDTIDEDDRLEAKEGKQKPFKCEECGKSFSQLRNYKYHRSVHEGTKEFAAKCTECGKTFNDRGYLSSHMKIHRDKKEYACPHCPKRFNQRVAYNMHLRIHTGIKPHECTVCGKSFSRKMLLKQHQRVHTGERPYSCPECGKTFADRSNMSLHARLHTGVKPYSCHLCTKSFTKKHHLKTHMNFHTGLKPYSCEKCGLAFSQSSNMRTHYKKCILKQITDTATSDAQKDSS